MIKKLFFFIFNVLIFCSINRTTGYIRVGDVVKIENLNDSWGFSGKFLADNGSGKTTLVSSGNINWIIESQKSGTGIGTIVTSATWPKLKNLATGKFLGTSGTPITMGTTAYANSSNEFWTPVNTQSNPSTTIDTLLTTYLATNASYQYEYVLNKGLKGEGTNAAISGYTTGIVPTLKTDIDYDTIAAFINSKGQILSYTNSKICNTSKIDGNPRNLWFIRAVSSPGTPGEASFTFDPATGTNRAYYNANWKSSSLSNFVIQFKAKTSGSIYIHICNQYNLPTDTPSSFVNTQFVAPFVNYDQAGFYYLIKIDSNIVQLYIYYGKDSSGTMIKKVFDGSASTLKSNTAEDWWLAIKNNNIIVLGKSITPGAGTICAWDIPTAFKIENNQYFAFGGSDQQTEYTDIKTATLPTTLSSPLTALNTMTCTATYIGSTTDTWPTKNTLLAIFNNLNQLSYQGDNGGNAIYNKLKGFYDSKTTDLNYLKNLKILLDNVKTKDFLLDDQKTEISTWLTNVDNEITSISLKTELASILQDATKSGTPALLNTNVISVTKFNLTYLQGANGGDAIYNKIKGFFNNRTAANLSSLKTLLDTAINKDFFSDTQKTDLSTCVTQVKNEITSSSSVSSTSAIQNAIQDNKNSFTSALKNATNPSALNAVINTPAFYNTTYLVNYPSTTDCVFTRIKRFFKYNFPIVTGSELTNLLKLLKNSKLPKFLTTTQKNTLITFTVNTELTIAYAGKSISTKCNTMTNIISKYKNKYKNKKLPAITSSSLYTEIMTPIYTTITEYGTLKNASQVSDRNACVKFFKSALSNCAFSVQQGFSIKQAIINLEKMR